ncbi:MAG: ferrous iron transport protein B [Anaerolineales bacterium]|nr:ferrous iron transport protein B [Anaerolineales bacterium]
MTLQSPPVNRRTEDKIIALIGHHNVGKSVLFSSLTGRQTISANYSGTTVDIARGTLRSRPDLTILDTPGVVTLPPRTEDELATERVLLNETLSGVVQVGDAKNLRRTLLLTIQLLEMQVPMVLTLNMMDEAAARGLELDTSRLQSKLGVPVIETVATSGQGLDHLTALLGSSPAAAPKFTIRYPAQIEAELERLERDLPAGPISNRAMALAWLSDDQVVEEWLAGHMAPKKLVEAGRRRQTLSQGQETPVSTQIQQARISFVDSLEGEVLVSPGSGSTGMLAGVGRLATHPLWGLLILAAVLLGMFWFVGVLGAGTLVDFLETTLFGELINPRMTGLVEGLIPFPLVVDFLVGEFGLWTMGITYAFALILPIVTTFFLAFGLLEDSGYLPRLAVLTNRIFKMMGLNGKAVVPMVLGLGCVTMATLSTRILETRRERLMAIILLALAIPCSAQLGVILGMLAATSFSAAAIWAGVMVSVVLLIGWLSARLIPGTRSSLLVEVPPMRVPSASTVALKTLARLEWYLKEVVPIFLAGTALLFFLDLFHILDRLILIGEPLVVDWLGLPAEASAAFLMGFLRRDFGATGLFMMDTQGLLSARQIVVAMVTITLFIPCFASVLMIARERSLKTAILLTALIFPLAFLIGGLLNGLLAAIGWGAS